MEVPELNEDILQAETNSDILNQGDDSASFDETALQGENQTSLNSDLSQTKHEDAQPEEKIQEQQDENEETLDDTELSKEEDESQVNLSQGSSLPETEEKEEDEVTIKKKPRLDDVHDSSLTPDQEPESDQEQQLKQAVELENQSHTEVEPEIKTENSDSQELLKPEKMDEENSDTSATLNKEGEKGAAGPDTDMLATLASAALEQNPKDKNSAAGATPKSPITKVEVETPKKKPEMWCNVGVFDTNTTVVSDYLATPEPNENVDLVSATLGGRRIQLEPGTAYKFRVCAVNGCGTGPWSDVAAFKTTLPGFPGAPSAIKISKSPEGAHLTWEPPGGNSSEILEYAVYLAVRSASQGCQPVTTNQAQLAFVRVFCGPTNKCMVGTNSLQAAHIDTTTKPAIIFRIAARNSKGYGPATQVRWLQESQNGTSQGVKRTIKS